MSGRGEESDSDAPEEFTSQQGIEKHEEITRVQRENKARIVREVKERRKKLAEMLTPRPARKEKIIKDAMEIGSHRESDGDDELLPDEIVKQLVAREKKVFASDSEEEKPSEKTASKKKRKKESGLGPTILEELPPPQCLQSSLDFLKKRKMQISRSSAVLDNPGKALRRLSTSGLL